ncbi:MAG: hypothetical protein ABI769_10640 [Pseudomonadota bacterium]
MLLLAPITSAGDLWQSPTLDSNSSYDSKNPAYRLVGVESGQQKCVAWVVADETVVHHQRSVNRIIRSVAAHLGAGTPANCDLIIHFYRASHPEPRDPSFEITEELGTYYGRDNKTRFMGDSSHYGGWAHGPGK